MLAELQQQVEFAAANSSDTSALTSLVEQARTVSSALNASYSEVLSMKETADKEINESVQNINSLLSQIEEVNNKIVTAAHGGSQEYDAMDVRDQLISELSDEIGIKVIQGDYDDVIITTTSGAMLFEGKPREVSFQPVASYGPNTTGGELRIDGVTVTGPNATLKIESGKIAGNFELRDNFLTEQQNQLDEIARGLIETFAEQDQTGGGKPALAGLFTWSGGPAIPAAGTLEPGIAATITINPLADASEGGDPALIRDGALNGDNDYLYNTQGGGGFSDRLYELSEAFDKDTVFDAAAGLTSGQSLNEFATAALDSHLRRVDHCFRIIPVHMKNRRFHHLRHVRRIGGRA